MDARGPGVIPRSLVICGIPFEVRVETDAVRRLHPEGLRHADGITAPAEQVLIVRTPSHFGQHYIRETLLHEAIHAVLALTGQEDRFKERDDDDAPDEEPVVAALATALLAALRANPELVAYLTEEVADAAA